jgi:type IV pilus assembly protein PilV
MRKNQKGFTLIEVVLGLVILAVGLLSLAGMQMTSVRGNAFSKQLSQATYVIQDRLEFLRYLSLDDPLLAAGTHDDGSTTLSGVVFNRSYNVVINNNLRTINYTVTYNDGTNHTRSIMTIRTQ